MGGSTKINRVRRSLLKVTGWASVIFGSTLAGRQAAANPSHHRHHHSHSWHGGAGHCFLRGTAIRTATGYAAIETLTAGDKISARFAGVVPIAAIDSFTLKRVAGEWTGPSRPVRVKRGALGDNIPAADICITASHAIFVDGVLVPVGDLVNGVSIVFDAAEGRETLEFHHIELASHDVIDAQGLPCESLRRPGTTSCVPFHCFAGRRSELLSRLRSAASPLVDRRQPIDLVRDRLEERSMGLAA
jgi:hypothetical protein